MNHKPLEMQNASNAICLRVDIATSFFMSLSLMAANPDDKRVKALVNKTIGFICTSI